MTRSRHTPWLLAAAAAPLLAAAAAPSTGSSAPTRAAAPAPDEYSDAKKKAETAYLTGLEELADWCNGEKAFRQRDAAYEAILVLDPEHKEARKFLKYTFDRKANEWVRKRPYKEPKEGDEEVVAQALEKRRALDAAYVEAQLALIERMGDKLSPKRRKSELELLMKASPDHERVRELLGYVKVERSGKTVWITAVAAETEGRREEIAKTIEECREKVPEAEDVDPIAPEPDLPVEFTVSLGNDRVRVVGDVDRDEAETAAEFGYMAYDLLPKLLGGKLDPLPDFTYYLLSDENKDAFIEAYPGIGDDDRSAFPQLRSGWMPGGWRVGCWARGPEFRLDVALKQTTAMYMQYVYGLKSERGWLVEGVGLYVNQLVLGTRFSYHIAITEYDDPSRPQSDREMPDTEEDWLEVAADILKDAKPTLLAATLGRNTSQLTVEDLVLSYSLAKYIREGYGADALAGIMKRVGSGDAGSVVVLEEFFDAKIPEIQEQMRVWIDEVGGNDFE